MKGRPCWAIVVLLAASALAQGCSCASPAGGQGVLDSPRSAICSLEAVAEEGAAGVLADAAASATAGAASQDPPFERGFSVLTELPAEVGGEAVQDGWLEVMGITEIRKPHIVADVAVDGGQVFTLVANDGAADAWDYSYTVSMGLGTSGFPYVGEGGYSSSSTVRFEKLRSGEVQFLSHAPMAGQPGRPLLDVGYDRPLFVAISAADGQGADVMWERWAEKVNADGTFSLVGVPTNRGASVALAGDHASPSCWIDADNAERRIPLQHVGIECGNGSARVLEAAVYPSSSCKLKVRAHYLVGGRHCVSDTFTAEVEVSAFEDGAFGDCGALSKELAALGSPFVTGVSDAVNRYRYDAKQAAFERGGDWVRL